MAVKVGDEEGQDSVNNRERNTDISQETLRDVVSLEEHKSPFGQTLSSRTEQDRWDGDINDGQSTLDQGGTVGTLTTAGGKNYI